MPGQIETIIDSKYADGLALLEYLRGKNELSLFNEAENNFRKNILLSSASYFEKEVTDVISTFSKIYSYNNDKVVSIISIKAIKRQYHTYFDWDKATNANSFFALFGEQFKNKMAQKVKDDDLLEVAIKSFLQIGQERNKLVHQNFAEAVIDKTASEIYGLYKNANYFIDRLKDELNVDIISDVYFLSGRAIKFSNAIIMFYPATESSIKFRGREIKVGHFELPLEYVNERVEREDLSVSFRVVTTDYFGNILEMQPAFVVQKIAYKGDIERRAQEIYRLNTDSNAVDNWLLAEKQLLTP